MNLSFLSNAVRRSVSRPSRRRRAPEQRSHFHYRPQIEELEERTVPTWIGALSGATNDAAHNYNNAANWAGGVIDDSFAGVAFATDTTLYFSANRTTGATGLNLNYNGNVDLSFQSTNATPFTLALGGPIAGDFGGAANSRTVNIGLAANPLNIDMGGAGTFNVAGTGDTLKVYNVISNGSLTKTGPGTLNLLGTNTYGGATSIQGGTLKLGGVATVPVGAAGYYSFDNTSGTGVGSTVNNGGTLGASKNGTLMSNATIGVGQGLRGSNALALTSNASSDFMGIALTGGQGLPLSSGQWTASAWFSNMFAPGSWRTLFRGNAGDGDHQIIVQSGGTALGMYNNSGVGPGGFNPSGYDVVAGGIQATPTWHQLTVVGYGPPAVGAPGFENIYIDGVLVGTTASGSNNGDIYAVGNYQGGGQAFASLLDEVYIYQSALSPAQVADLFNATGPTVPAAPGASNYIPDTSAVTVAAGATLDLGGYSETIGSLAGAGNVLLGAGTLTLGGDGTSTTFTGVISGSGSVVKTGAGIFTLGGTNTYTGSTTVNGGGLVNNGTLPGSLTFNGGGSLVNNGTIPGNVTIGSGSLTNAGTIGGNVSIGTGNLTNAGSIGGTVSITTGNLTDTGTITGNTTVNSGNTSGNGSVGGSLSVGAGTFTPGPGTATFTVGGNLTLGGSSTLAIVLAGVGSNSQVTATGAANLGGAALSLASQFKPLAGTTFTIVTANGGVSGQLSFNGSVLANGSFFSAGGARFRISYTPTSIVLTSLGATPPPALYAVGADAGGVPLVSVYDASGRLTYSFIPFPLFFTGGARVAIGDVNGDGVNDLIAVAGAGGGPEVNVYDGRNFQMIRAFYALPPTFTGGLYVATGDVNGDGADDIIVGAGAGGLDEVEVYDGRTGNIITAFFPFGQFATGGVRVAAGDVNGDGRADVIAGAGPGGLPQVTIYDGLTLNVFGSILAYPVFFTGGVWVASGDVNLDGHADIITGAGPGGSPVVNVFDGVTRNLLKSFMPMPSTFTGGVRVAARDLNGDGRAEVIAGAGPTGLAQVSAFDFQTLAALESFFAFNPVFRGGVYVG